MQVNGVNSFSNAQTFRGEEGKKINKKAIAAGVIAAAAVATTVAAGLHGKKILNAPDFVGPQEKGLKKAVKCVKIGFGEAWNKVSAKANETIKTIKERFKGKASEAQAATEDLAEGAAEVAEEIL